MAGIYCVGLLIDTSSQRFEDDHRDWTTENHGKYDSSENREAQVKYEGE